MAKKTKARRKSSGQQAKRQQTQPASRGWRQRTVLGAVILLLVIGIGAFMRYQQQRMLAPRLQGALDNHYTRGTAGAPVVIKEFSDFA
ncbi:hypothetical protein NKDENANG_00873 [Candidatus Entotheonellaceae bacterium PAL068K]